MITKEPIGNRYSRLVVTAHHGFVPNGKKRASAVVCACDCGKSIVVAVTSIRSGNTKSCGCLKMELLIKRSTTTGLARHPLRPVWGAMIDRCTNTRAKRYSDYGGRGITVCKEWKDNFLNFYNWAITNGYAKGLQVDRVDNNKGYSPDNCRIASSTVNGRNKRNNRVIEYNGESHALSYWSEKLGLSYPMLQNRLRKGDVTSEKLFETPHRYEKFKLSNPGSVRYYRSNATNGLLQH
jgi:hypothetical protein